MSWSDDKHNQYTDDARKFTNEILQCSLKQALRCPSILCKHEYMWLWDEKNHDKLFHVSIFSIYLLVPKYWKYHFIKCKRPKRFPRFIFTNVLEVTQSHIFIFIISISTNIHNNSYFTKCLAYDHYPFCYLAKKSETIWQNSKSCEAHPYW